MDERKGEMGSHKNPKSIRRSGKSDKADPGAEYTSGYLYHQQGKRLLACRLLPEQLAV